MDTLVFIGIESGDNVRVSQLCGGLHLSVETRNGSGIIGDFGRQDLDRHQPIHAAVAGQIDVPHAAGSNDIPDFIDAQRQAAALPLDDHRDLKLRQAARPDQFVGQLLGRGGYRLAACKKRV